MKRLIAGSEYDESAARAPVARGVEPAAPPRDAPPAMPEALSGGGGFGYSTTPAAAASAGGPRRDMPWQAIAPSTGSLLERRVTPGGREITIDSMDTNANARGVARAGRAAADSAMEPKRKAPGGSIVAHDGEPMVTRANAMCPTFGGGWTPAADAFLRGVMAHEPMGRVLVHTAAQ